MWNKTYSLMLTQGHRRWDGTWRRIREGWIRYSYFILDSVIVFQHVVFGRLVQNILNEGRTGDTEQQ